MAIVKKTAFALLSVGLFQAHAIDYNPKLSVIKNADNIAKSCTGIIKDKKLQNACYDTAKKTYQAYVETSNIKRAGYFLTDSIQSSYKDKVVVSTHSYTMYPSYASDVIDYAYEKGATGLFVSLQGHRTDGVKLKDINGKEWIEDINTVTKIAQGFGNKVVLAGFSLGGILSIQQAKANPNMVAGYLAMAPSFHGGEQLPYSEISCLARSSIIRGVAEGISGYSLSNDFILGGCAIFRVSKQITSNVQNSIFAKYDKKNERFQDEKSRARSSMRNLKMPGVILYSDGDTITNVNTTAIMTEILKEIAGSNFHSVRYPSGSGLYHSGDGEYFDKSLKFSGYDAIDLLFKKI